MQLTGLLKGKLPTLPKTQQLTAINTSTFTSCCRCVGINQATESRRRRCGKTSGKRANGRDEHPFTFIFCFQHPRHGSAKWANHSCFHSRHLQGWGKKRDCYKNIEVIRSAFCLRLSCLRFILAARGCLHTSVWVSEILRALRWHETGSLTPQGGQCRRIIFPSLALPSPPPAVDVCECYPSVSCQCQRVIQRAVTSRQDTSVRPFAAALPDSGPDTARACVCVSMCVWERE